MRLIDADEAKEGYCRACALDQQKCGGDCSYLRFLDRQPTFDPERHAHWIPHAITRPVYILVSVECSKCRGESDKETKYCPDCGALMNEVDDD